MIVQEKVRCYTLQFNAQLCNLSVSCGALDDPDNGAMTCSGTGSVYGDTCSFTCDDGFALAGSATRTCQSDRTWNGSVALCEQGNFGGAL